MNKILGTDERWDRFYVYFKNKTEINEINLTNNLKIYIPKTHKRKVLIRKINKYLKENFSNSKITNNKSEANVIVVDHTELSQKSSEHSYTLTDAGKINITYRNFNLQTGVKEKKLYKIYFSKREELELNDIKNYITGNLHFIFLSSLQKISHEQFINDSEKLNLNPEKILEMIKNKNSCHLLHVSLANADLTPYLEQIITGYYLTEDDACRSIVYDKILKRYPERDKILKFRSCYNYMRTLKNLNFVPDKEIVLKWIGYYDK